MHDRGSCLTRKASERRFEPSAAWSWWLVCALVSLVVTPAAGQDAGSLIKAEVERLQQSLKEKPLSHPDFPNANAGMGDLLKSVLQAQAAGKLYVSLEQLAQAEDFVYGVWLVMDKAEAVKGGLPIFEIEWEKASASVDALNRDARASDSSGAPVMLQALIGTALGKTLPLLEGGREFAVATEPKDGLFNPGEAKGEAQFAAFCASLHLRRNGTPYPLRTLLPELQQLQQKTNAAFQPPRSIELQTQFMVLNSTLKLAQDFDASRFYAGALSQYLLAVFDYGMLDTIVPGPAEQAALKNALAAARRRLDASLRDDSMAQFILEHAELNLAHPDGSAPSADDWKAAKVMLDQVLPAYYAAEKPPAMVAQAAGKTVDITLVRWPYT
jgi:hypothetical protein